MKYISHRGLSTTAQEHSPQALSDAILARFDIIEVDVRLTYDKKLVLAHDSSLKKLFGSKLIIEKTPYSQLQIEVKKRNGFLITLEEAINLVSQKARLMVELKGKGTGLALSNKILDKNLTVSSFYWNELSRVVSSEYERAKLRRWWPFVSNRQISKYGLSYIGLRKNLICSLTISRAKKQGLKVFAWTTNNPRSINRFKKLGVDYVVCDFIPKP